MFYYLYLYNYIICLPDYKNNIITLLIYPIASKDAIVMKIFIISISTILVLGLMYFIYAISWIYRLNVKLDGVGNNLSDTFNIELPLLRDPNGYFCIMSKLDNLPKESFILDTRATSLARIETLQKMKARYWGTYPVFAKNTYGQMEKLSLYELKSLTIGKEKLQKPLFKGITKTNAIHNLLYKKVIGRDILQHFTWKFSLDENKLTLFSNKNNHQIQLKTQGFHLIKDGLIENKIILNSPLLSDSYKFSFDLGYQGEISIDKKIFQLLKDKSPCIKYLNARTSERIDTTYVFPGITIEWDGFQIPDCELRYYPLTNRNLIGVRFIEQFNFILGYQKSKEGPRSSNLYIQPRKINLIDTNNYSRSNFGFEIGLLNGTLQVTSIEIGGKAEQTGLKVKDKVIDIDQNSIHLDEEYVLSGQINNYLCSKSSILIKVKRDNKIIEYKITT